MAEKKRRVSGSMDIRYELRHFKLHYWAFGRQRIDKGYLVVIKYHIPEFESHRGVVSFPCLQLLFVQERSSVNAHCISAQSGPN